MYRPPEALLQSFATCSIVPPGWVATNQFRVTVPPLPELPHPAAIKAKHTKPATPTSRSLNQAVAISSSRFDWPPSTLSDPSETLSPAQP